MYTHWCVKDLIIANRGAQVPADVEGEAFVTPPWVTLDWKIEERTYQHLVSTSWFRQAHASQWSSKYSRFYSRSVSNFPWSYVSNRHQVNASNQFYEQHHTKERNLQHSTICTVEIRLFQRVFIISNTDILLLVPRYSVWRLQGIQLICNVWIPVRAINTLWGM